MNHLYSFSFVITLLISLATYAQDGWFWQLPQPTGNDFIDLCAIDEHTVFAVGEGGIILSTTDDGNDWDVRYQEEYKDLHGVGFFNSNEGLIVGEKSTILKTNDGGQSWIPQLSTSTENFNSLYIKNEIAWLCGDDGIIYKTIDKGLSWEDQSVDVNLDLNSVFFLDEQRGWIAGQGEIILHTKDGGDSWIIQKNARSGWFAALYSLKSICFKDSLYGWASGAGDFHASYYTEDGGQTWINSEDFSYGTAVTFFDSNHGWWIGGSIYRTADGGLTWMRSDSSESIPWTRKVDFVDIFTGWAIGSNGVIMKSINSGNNWHNFTCDKISIESIVFRNELNGAAVGKSGSFLITEDGGDVWQNIKFTSTNLNDLCLYDEQYFFAVGDSGKIVHGDFSQPTSNWQESIVCNSNILSVLKIEEGNVWSVGENSTVLFYDKSQKVWEQIDTGVSGNYTDIAFADANTGFIIGDLRWNILRTHDKGKTWTEINIPDSPKLKKIDFITPEVGYIVGSQSRILKTVDGGLTWTQMNYPISRNNHFSGIEFRGFHFFNENHGILISDRAEIFETIDGCVTWEEQYQPLYSQSSYDEFGDIFFLNDQIGWVVSNYNYGGGILKTLSAGHKVVPPPTAFFTSDVISGLSPLTVNFQDLSEGDYKSLIWNFGDNTSDSIPNPIHTYSTPGTYSVSLKINGLGGSDSHIKENYIMVFEEGFKGEVSGRWSKDNSPYYIREDIIIPLNKELYIEQGVEVIFENYSINPINFIVNGRLEAKGSATDSIVFRCNNTPNGLAHWGGIDFNNVESTDIFTYIKVADADTGIHIKANGTSSPINIQHSTITGSREIGILFEAKAGGDFSRGSVFSSTITKNRIGVKCLGTSNSIRKDNKQKILNGNSNPGILHNLIIDNMTYGIQCEGRAEEFKQHSIDDEYIEYGMADPFILKNIISQNGQAGIYCEAKGNFVPLLAQNFIGRGFVKAKIRNNIFRSNSANGIQCKTTLKDIDIINLEILNNTFDKHDYASIIMPGQFDSSEFIISNNIFIESQVGIKKYIEQKPPIVEHNNFYLIENYFSGFNDSFGSISGYNEVETPCDSFMNIFANPVFDINSEVEYFLSSKSPCIDAGKDYGLPYLGNRPDIGAHEFDPTTTKVEAPDHRILRFELLQNYPNPFNSSTTITFSLPAQNQVKLKIYNIHGKLVKAIINKKMESGIHNVVWHGLNSKGRVVSSGIYLYKIETDSFSDMKRMLLVK